MAIYDSQLTVVALYLLIIIAIYSAKFITPLNELLQYGKTVSQDVREHARLENNLIKQTIGFISKYFVVPKAWFVHFYITLFALSSLIFLASFNEPISSDPEKFKNLILIHRLLWVQGIRRLTECLTITNFSKTSKMNVSHYVVGLSHYILVTWATYLGLSTYGSHQVPNNYTVFDIVLIIGFAICSLLQFQAHYHLSTLVKYTLPDFNFVSSPHYFYEILIYTILLSFAIKDGFDMVSVTFFTAWLFVISNLSISSLETFSYYQKKYKEEFKLKWAILPGIL